MTSGFHERPVPPSLASTIRDFADVARLSTWRSAKPDAGIPLGDHHTVLFAPGMACGDFTSAPVRTFLKEIGYDAVGWDIGVNIGPTRRTMRTLEARLFAHNDRSGRRVSLIGKSLGGFIVRELAKRHPERIRRLILICAPIRHPIANRLAPAMYALAPLFDDGLPRDHKELSQPAPVPTTALYTKTDGLLAWQCCLEEAGPLAENIELTGAFHTTAAMHPLALRAMASRLALPDRT
jgi:pimeloyl-ACP methyl ester carboxylesterase